jgi:hypothetical protein
VCTVRAVDPLDKLVDVADLDELLREVDRLCERRDWAELVRLRDMCRAALDRGRQVWPIASHVEHRLALEGPAEQAAAVLVPAAGHLGLGPISEVAASTHTWAELAPHAPPTPVAALAAHERVVRGEPVDAATLAVPVLDLPLRLQPWEPDYPVATYTAHSVDAPRPPLPELQAVRVPDAPGVAVGVDDPVAAALLETVAAWTAESNGRAAAVSVEGDAPAAAARLLETAAARTARPAGDGQAMLRLGRLEVAEALALLGWAGGSGGAHGRRRGAARGRFDAWWALAALCGLDDLWPPDGDELGAAAAELRWYWWDAAEPDTGWTLRLAVEDPLDGLAWAISATDAA